MSDVLQVHRHHSDLLLLRLWTEEVTDGQTEWCGKVQHVVSGRAATFRGFSELENLLATMIVEGEQGHDPATNAAQNSERPPQLV